MDVPILIHQIANGVAVIDPPPDIGAELVVHVLADLLGDGYGFATHLILAIPNIMLGHPEMFARGQLQRMRAWTAVTMTRRDPDERPRVGVTVDRRGIRIGEPAALRLHERHADGRSVLGSPLDEFVGRPHLPPKVRLIGGREPIQMSVLRALGQKEGVGAIVLRQQYGIGVVGIIPSARPIPVRSKHLDAVRMRCRGIGSFVIPGPVARAVHVIDDLDAHQRHAQRSIERLVLGGRKSSAPRGGKAEAVDDLLVCGHVDVARGVSVKREGARRHEDGQGANCHERMPFHFHS